MELKALMDESRIDFRFFKNVSDMKSTSLKLNDIYTISRAAFVIWRIWITKAATHFVWFVNSFCNILIFFVKRKIGLMTTETDFYRLF